MSALTDFFTSLANKIRSKTGSSATMTPTEMIDAIDDIATPLQTKTVTAGTSATTVTPDTGYALSSVTVNPTPSQTKSATPSTSAQTISPDSGNLLSSVSVAAISPVRTSSTLNQATSSGVDSKAPYVYFPYGWWPSTHATYGAYVYMTAAQAQATHNHTTTYTASSRGASLDMGQKHAYRYVNTNSVPNTNSGTYTYPANSTGATYDMGTTNTIRYVNAANVYAKGKADGKSISSVPTPNQVTSLNTGSYANLNLPATPSVGDILIIFTYGSSADVTMDVTGNLTQLLKTTAVFGSRCPLIVGTVKTVPSSNPLKASSYVSCSGGWSGAAVAMILKF